jgi:hypothetical protein
MTAQLALGLLALGLAWVLRRVITRVLAVALTVIAVGSWLLRADATGGAVIATVAALAAWGLDHFVRYGLRRRTNVDELQPVG